MKAQSKPGFGRVVVPAAVVVVTAWAMLVVSAFAASSPRLGSGLGAGSSSTAMGVSAGPVVSADGRVAAYTSSAGNLLRGAAHEAGALDVFAERLDERRRSLVSANTNGLRGNARSHSPAISADGRYIAFVSDASDLVPADENRASDVFVRDLVGGTTLLVSVAMDGVHGGAGASDGPVITPDGRFVAFESWATNLVEGDTNGLPDVFLRDLVHGVTHWISRPSVDPNLGSLRSGASRDPVVSADGTIVVFASDAQNLAASPRQNQGQLYRRDLRDGTTAMLDVWPASVAGTTAASLGHRLSDDGRWLVTQLYFPSPGVTSGVYRVDLGTWNTEAVAPMLNTARVYPVGFETAGPFTSSDGQNVVFEARPPSTGAIRPGTVYAGAPGVVPTLLSTNRALVPDVPPERRPYGHLLAASSTTEFVAFLGYGDQDATSSNNGPLQIWLARRSTGELRRLGSAPESSEGATVAFSRDGRRVVFDTDDPGIVPADDNGDIDAFAYDWDTERVTLLSSRDPDRVSATGTGPSGWSLPSVSQDGRWLAYTKLRRRSGVTNPAGSCDLVVTDLSEGSTRIVSAGVDGPGTTARMVMEPSLSADGQWVAFTSTARFFGGTTTPDGIANIYLANTKTPELVLVSRTADSGAGGSSDSLQPAISPDGRWVAFVSGAALVATDGNNARDVYLFDRQSGSVRLVTTNVLGTGSANGNSANPRWSPDGRWLLFESTAVDLTSQFLSSGRQRWYAWDSTEGRTVALGTSGRSGVASGWAETAVFSRDGRRVAFTEELVTKTISVRGVEGFATVATIPAAGLPRLDGTGRRVAYRVSDRTPANGQVRVVDLLDNTTVEVSVGPGGVTANAIATGLEISGDGRFVFFTSHATNLHPEAVSGSLQLYARDLKTGTTLLVSRAPTGGAANDGVARMVLSPDGSRLFFSTRAINLAVDDDNGDFDIYSVRVAGEAEAPVLAVTRLASGTVVLVWSASEGTRDRVEFKEDLESANWRTLGPPDVIQGGESVRVDESGRSEARRFYRVRRD